MGGDDFHVSDSVLDARAVAAATLKRAQAAFEKFTSQEAVNYDTEDELYRADGILSSDLGGAAAKVPIVIGFGAAADFAADFPPVVTDLGCAAADVPSGLYRADGIANSGLCRAAGIAHSDLGGAAAEVPIVIGFGAAADFAADFPPVATDLGCAAADVPSGLYRADGIANSGLCRAAGIAHSDLGRTAAEVPIGRGAAADFAADFFPVASDLGRTAAEVPIGRGAAADFAADFLPVAKELKRAAAELPAEERQRADAELLDAETGHAAREPQPETGRTAREPMPETGPAAREPMPETGRAAREPMQECDLAGAAPGGQRPSSLTIDLSLIAAWQLPGPKTASP
jgi:hypothetical protein